MPVLWAVLELGAELGELLHRDDWAACGGWQPGRPSGSAAG